MTADDWAVLADKLILALCIVVAVLFALWQNWDSEEEKPPE